MAVVDLALLESNSSHFIYVLIDCPFTPVFAFFSSKILFKNIIKSPE